MAFKRLLILGGAALLVAGCGTNTTAPTSRSEAVGASADLVAPIKKKPLGPTINSMSSDSTACLFNWPIVSGYIDSTCVIEDR